ncbi:MAG: helix-hairpin-helix domain-containing protein [Kofleriaceae bacterium]|nr:helix-hairpin-helix domain-containing protein [Kofleriaceae bacterium]
MDPKVVSRVVASAVASLGLDGPLRPWWLLEAKPPRPVRRIAVLASPTPSPYDLDPALLLAAFPAADRASIARQIDASYQQLVVLSAQRKQPATQHDRKVVCVQLGMPLLGRDRVLIRICTRNSYGDGQLVTGEFHAWLTPDGKERKGTSPAQQQLASAWPRWVVGRSPGLGAAVDLNAANESELLRLPGINEKKARAIIASRPFATTKELADVKGIGMAGADILRDLVTV